MRKIDWNRAGLVYIICALGAYWGQLTVLLYDSRIVGRTYDFANGLAFTLIWGYLLVWVGVLLLDALEFMLGKKLIDYISSVEKND